MRGLPLLLLIITAIMVLVFSSPSAAQTEDEWRFGVVEAYTAPNSARELGIGWTRIRFQWADTQVGGPDTWTPEVSDELIDHELAEGRLVLGLLIGIPEWARDEDGLPDGLWLDADDPQNTWGQFVRQVVGQYAGRIDHWVIWNEPDIGETAVAHTWDGTVDDFYQLQRVAYLAAKEANPQAVIHLSAFTYWADFAADREQYMARLLDRILIDPQAPAFDYYFDVATAHLYFQPDQIYELLILFRRIMADRGLDKPIWLVETNAPPHDDPSWEVADWTFSVSQGEQATFMAQALAAGLAAGAERIGVYKMKDTAADRQANPEPFGLLRLDGSRRPAFNALHVAMENLSGAKAVTRDRWDTVGVFHSEQADRRTGLYFSRLPQDTVLEVPAEAGTALLVDMWGVKRPIAAENGFYTIDLPGANCTQPIGDYCMIGGEPVYLIQAIDGGPPPEGPPPILPPPAIRPTLPPTPTVLLTETAVPTSTPSPSPAITTAALLPSETATAVPPPATATEPSARMSSESGSNPSPSPTSASPQLNKGGISGLVLLVIGGVLAVLLLGVWGFSRKK